mmetsp:Transcript_84879/g.181873  ORF Transcript_84879/g.181873 Transcript_84879/m.181873 type:complete len:271 (+) Transcript_84879:1533-2345(+)
MLLDLHSHHGQVLHLLVRGRPLHLVLWLGVDGLRAATLLVYHLDQLRAHGARHDGVLALSQGGLEDVPLVRVHRAPNHRLTEAIRTGDEDNILEAALGVQREHHAGGPSLAAHHLLAGGAELHLLVLEAAVMAVGDSSVSEERGEDEVHLLLHVLVAHDVQVGLLLPCEGGIGQVFGGGRGTYCEGESVAAAAHTLPLGFELLFELWLEGRIHDLVADSLPHFHELVNIRINGLIGERCVDEVVDATLVKELLVRMGGGAEASWHRHANL